MLKYFILLLACIHLSFAVQEKELVKKMIDEKVNQFPAMKDTISRFFPNIPNRENYINGQGFTKFSQKNDVIKYESVPHGVLNDFLNYLTDLIQVKPAKKASVVKQLALTKYAGKQNINVNELMFAVGGADCKYSTILGVRNRDGSTTDWFVSDIKLSFQLAPDILFLKQKTSSLWGLIKKEKITIKIIPKTLTEQQMSIIGEYFQIVTWQGFKDILSIEFRRRNLRFLAWVPKTWKKQLS